MNNLTVSQFNKVAIFKFLLPLMAGIVLGYYLPLSEYIITTLLIFSIIALGIVSIWLNKRPSRNTIWWYWLSCMIFMCFGALKFKVENNNLLNNKDIAFASSFIAVVNSLPETKSYSTEYEIKLKYCSGGDNQIQNSQEIKKSKGKDNLQSTKYGWRKCQTKCLLKINSKLTYRLKPGMYIIIRDASLSLSDIRPFPESMSQKDLFYSKNLSGIISIYDSSKLTITPIKENSLYYSILNFRDWLLSSTGQYFSNSQEESIFQSLLLGYRAQIDYELKNAYATAGVMHILSVSGLHVGIIYLFLIFITGPLKKLKYGKSISATITLSGIWFYSIISGFSPPVIRSACMFSFQGISQLLQRQALSFNSLFLSAFIILLVDPSQLFDIGFQLSYLAMSGIFIFYEPINKVNTIDNSIATKTWELISLSISAQLGTLPLTIYYFHNLPLYFLLANLIIVPFTSLILYVGIVFLILSPLNFIAGYIAQLVSLMISLLNQSVLFVERLPYASITGFYPNMVQTVILYILILLIAYLVYSKNFRIVVPLICGVILYQSVEIVKIAEASKARQIIVSSISKAPVISVYNCNKLIHFTFDDNLPNKKVTDNYKRINYVHTEEFINLTKIKKDTIINGCNISFNKEKYYIHFGNHIFQLTSSDKTNKIAGLITYANENDIHNRHYFYPTKEDYRRDKIKNNRKERKNVSILSSDGYYLIELN
jgi:competence protein ComEC